MIKRLGIMLAALIMTACAPSPDCLEAQRLYDEAPSAWAGVLTATVCAR